MAFEFDPLYIITIISVSVAAIVGVFTIKNEIKKGKEESAAKITNQIESVQKGVTNHIDEKLNIMDSKFQAIHIKIGKEEDDIEDIERDMKQMARDFKSMCDKVSKFDFVLDSVLPDFKALQRDFYKFKTAFDIELANKKNILVNQNENDEGDIR